MVTYNEVKTIVENKLINKTETRSYEELSEEIFGEGNCFNESEVRKRMYGMRRLIEIIDNDNGAIDVATRILSISDLHIPFQLPIETFTKYANRVDVLVLNGDIQDAQNVSKWSKKYRVSFNEEMIAARSYMIELIKMINPKKVVVVKGNHEARALRYISDKLNDDLLSLMPDSPLDLIVNDGFKNHDRLNKATTWYSPLVEVFAETNIEISYTGEWYRKVGKTIFAHPLSYASGMLKTTEKAVNYFLRVDRDFDTIVLGHTHKLGSYIQGNISLFEQGCCAKLDSLDYADGNLTIPAQNGFVYLCQDKDGNLLKDRTELVSLG